MCTNTCTNMCTNMHTIIRCASLVLVYSTGAYASYSDINRNVIQPPIKFRASEPQSLISHIELYTRFSYQHAKDYYITRVNPVVYSAAWPIVQFTMVSTSIFTGTLCGFLEWNDK
jgi:hypothetical protein